MKGIFADFLMLACGAILAFSLMTISLEQAIVLQKDEWRCIEYLPGSTECAMFERVGKPHE